MTITVKFNFSVRGEKWRRFLSQSLSLRWFTEARLVVIYILTSELSRCQTLERNKQIAAQQEGTQIKKNMTHSRHWSWFIIAHTSMIITFGIWRGRMAIFITLWGVICGVNLCSRHWLNFLYLLWITIVLFCAFFHQRKNGMIAWPTDNIDMYCFILP